MKRITLALLLFTSFSYGIDKYNFASYMWYAINDVRDEAGKKPLEFSPVLCLVAQYHDDEQAKYKYFGHKSKVNGDDINDRMSALAEGLLITDYGENIHYCSISSGSLTLEQFADKAMTGFINSSAHYNGMISSKYNAVGIGVGVGVSKDKGYKTSYYTTCVFAHISAVMIDWKVIELDNINYVYVELESVDGKMPNSAFAITPNNKSAGVTLGVNKNTGNMYMLFGFYGTGKYKVVAGKAEMIVYIN